MLLFLLKQEIPQTNIFCFSLDSDCSFIHSFIYYSCSSIKYFKNIAHKTVIFIISSLKVEFCSYAHIVTYQILQYIPVRYAPA